MVEGEQILGRFDVGERLGQGGFGVVHRAWDRRLERPVAVKEIAGGDTRRVLREAQAGARLNHRAIVTLYELGRDGSCAYLVSELIEGATLRRLCSMATISDRDVAVIGVELTAALEHSHGRGVVHRDLKPENVIVVDGRVGSRRRARGRVKLMDFGTAHLSGASTLTASGGVLGTIAYMAPEQADGTDAGPPADVYSLALILYECWSGANPVARATPAATARAIGSRVPALETTRPDLPSELAATIDACLDPMPEHRPSGPELEEALSRAIPALDAGAAVPIPAEPEAPAGDHAPRPSLVPVLAIAAAIAALVAIGRPGTALVAAVLLVPAVLVVANRPAWALPALAPPLGAIGLAPLYVLAAGLAGRSGPARAGLGALGVLWIALVASVLGLSSPLTGVERAPAGWSGSATDALVVLGSALVPEALGLAVIWATASAALGFVLALRPPGLMPVAAVVWAAALIAAHRVLDEANGAAASAAPDVAAVLLTLAVLAVAIARAARETRGAPGEPPLATLDGPTAAPRRRAGRHADPVTLSRAEAHAARRRSRTHDPATRGPALRSSPEPGWALEHAPVAALDRRWTGRRLP